MVKLSDKDKVEILKGYLGVYFVRPDKTFTEKLRCLKLSLKEDMFILCPFDKYKQLISFYLLLGGRKEYEVLNAYRLIDIFLDKYPEHGAILELDVPYLILLYGFGESVNVRQWEFINQIISHRRRLELSTIFIGIKKVIESDFGSNIDGELSFRFLNLFDQREELI